MIRMSFSNLLYQAKNRMGDMWIDFNIKYFLSKLGIQKFHKGKMSFLHKKIKDNLFLN